MEQLDLFSIEHEHVEIVESFTLESIQVGDSVACVVTEADSETYYYLKYYYPQALTVRGEVLAVNGNVVTVRFKSDVVLLELHQVRL